MVFRFENFFFALIISDLSIATLAESSDSDVCDQSIEHVAASSFVPRAVIFKIARLETGRRVDGRIVSWPWSLNNGGKAYYLKDSATALRTLAKLMAEGEKNIDVGCMQLNIRWHSEFFNSLEQMMNPLHNVRYAARYLETLYKETGSWEKAVRYYHSRNTKFNDLYYAKFRKMKLPSTSQMLASSQLSKELPSFQNLNAVYVKPLFWTGSTGSLFQSGYGESPSAAFADIRNFSVAPLVIM